jgi:phosphatidate cytidylyltransferase
MLKRILTSIVALAVFIPILIFSDTWVFPIAMALCSLAGCYEMLGCIGQKKNAFIAIPVYILAVLSPIGMRYAYTIGRVDELLKLALGILLLVSLYIFSVSVFANKSITVTDSGLIISSVTYIIAAFTSIVYIRDVMHLGEYVYLLVFLGAWISDIFAYFTGRLLGKHKLIPSVSPKKTVEGAIGGVIFCVLTTVIFGFVITKFFVPISSVKANYLVLAVSGIFISVVSQTGDLIMSLIKRHYGIKDYGNIFPGHGGFLDRFDSVMAVSIILAFICTYFNLFAVGIIE